MGRLIGAVLVAVGAAVLCSATGASAASPRALAEKNGTFFGDSCPSASRCEAVGAFFDDHSLLVPLAEGWNGSSWGLQSVPAPSGATGGSALDAVSCAGATSCTAVGYETPSGGAQPLSARWAAGTWSLVSVPKPSGATSSELTGVACTGATACEAVGYERVGGTERPLVERETSGGWGEQSAAAPTGASASLLDAVACHGPSDCLAVGAATEHGHQVGFALAWNGSRWTAASPTAGPAHATAVVLTGVACPSATSCEAAGSATVSSTSVPVAEVRSGSTWRLQHPSAVHASKGAGFQAVACTGPGACELAGQSSPGIEENAPIVEALSNGTWTVRSVPRPSSEVAGFNAVSCSGATGCTAVGYDIGTVGANVVLAERWNGQRWSIETTPDQTGVIG